MLTCTARALKRRLRTLERSSVRPVWLVQVYGRPGDLAALREELAIAPEHTLLLWPGEGALTVGRHVES